jgi:hypothetical protein
MENKTLQQKFSEGEKLSLIDSLSINLLRTLSDCDGMCGLGDVCGYCEAYKNNLNGNKKEYKIN